MSECLDWYDKNNRRQAAGLLLLVGDLAERRTEKCRAEGCDDKENCIWLFWGEIETYIEQIISTLTPEEIEHLEVISEDRGRYNVHSPKAEPMKTMVLYDLLRVDESDLIEMNEEYEGRNEIGEEDEET